MNIMINTVSEETGFCGYDYFINRTPSNDGTTSVERASGGYNFTDAGKAEYKVFGNVMVVTVPLETLGLTSNSCYIRFKVADNVQNPEDIMNYYISGDSAPIGRLSYSYGA